MMRFDSRLARATMLAGLLAWPTLALALPMTRTVSNTVDDALIELRVLEQHIRGDNRSWCEVRINVRGSEVPFSAGDELFLWVYENDLAGDEELWTTTFTVSDAEVTAQLVNRTFDCTSNFGSDIGANLEIYAEARVEKAMCGAFCIYDRPETSAVPVLEVDDDAAEMDDSPAAASTLVADTTAVRRSLDADYHQIELGGPGAIDLSAFYRPGSGRLDVEVLDSTETLLATAVDRASGAGVTTGALAPGTYYVRVTPRASPDYQFYDLLVSVSSASCAPGSEETRVCDLCGRESRSCESGTWGTWTECGEQGECNPDEMDTRGCGLGGMEVRTCSETCEWGDFGMCMGMNTDDDAGPDDDGGFGRDSGGPGPRDAGSRFDAGSRRDAGSGASIDSGCGCGTVESGSDSTFALLLALFVLARVRQRRSPLNR